MKRLKVQPEQLINGCVLKEPVYSLTARPIVPRKTILNDTHIEFIKIFMIKEIEVEELLNNGELFNPQPVSKVVDNSAKIREAFIKEYLTTVESYKRQFKSWKNGGVININELRKIHYSLLEKALECQEEVFHVYDYSKSEDYNYHHTVATSLMSAVLASKLNNNLMDSFQISFAALLCNVGMIDISDEIINKSGELTEEEKFEISKHPGIGFRILSTIPGITDEIKIAVLQHHERLDGSGYPLGISGAKIHYYAKIISIADEFHSLTCDHNQYKKVSPYRAIEILTSDYIGKFDMGIVKVLSDSVCNLAMGDIVKLSNGLIGEIIFVDPVYKSRPIVKIDESNMISLTNNLNLYIDEVL